MITDLIPKSSLIQGPLAGVSSAPFRHFLWHYGASLAYATTEMISVNTILNGPEEAVHRLLDRYPEEKRLCVQLSSHDPERLEKAVAIISHQADLVDLNVGCPMKKIRQKKEGSGLLKHPSLLKELVLAMKQGTNKPVTVKIRVDGHSSDQYNHKVIEALNEAKPDAVVVHGRHYLDDYTIPPHYDQIAHFVKHLTMPVIGNGDVKCLDSLQRMFQTGCHAVMIGRGAMGRPWLFSQLQAALESKSFVLPSLKEQGRLAKEHIIHLANWINSEKHAVLQARRWIKYYHYDRSDKLVNAAHNLETMNDVYAFVDGFFRD
ncbi:MAG: tRNA dihydrouridine synthase [Candidatus Comchoanobacterales bacterium]